MYCRGYPRYRICGLGVISRGQGLQTLAKLIPKYSNRPAIPRYDLNSKCLTCGAREKLSQFSRIVVARIPSPSPHFTHPHISPLPRRPFPPPQNLSNSIHTFKFYCSMYPRQIVTIAHQIFLRLFSPSINLNLLNKLTALSLLVLEESPQSWFIEVDDLQKSKWMPALFSPIVLYHTLEI